MRLLRTVPGWLSWRRQCAIGSILNTAGSFVRYPEYRKLAENTTKKKLKRLSVWKLIETRERFLRIWAELHQRGQNVFG